MNNIKKLVIKGFKIFEDFEIEFNNGMNILIGDNESGKSTILEAIDIVLNKKYANYDKYIVKEILNKKIVETFEENKSFSILPKVEIYLFLNLDKTCDIDYEFKGEIKIDNVKYEDYGIKFTCQFNDDFRDDLMSAILEGKIPYDYYDMTWETFQGKPYNSLRKPIKYLSIDNSKVDISNTYNYYNRNLYYNKYDNLERLKISNDFRSEINGILEKVGANKLNDNSEFGIDNRKVILENILTVLENKISLDNKGKGRENLIKTEIALNKSTDKLNIISIEEPENHLSHINLRRMLENIKNVNNDDNPTQIIVTTHNSLIVNTLNLSNVIWISDRKAKSLKSINNTSEGKNAIKFFEKADNLNLLQFILSPKVILVEGPTEYLILQKAYREIVDDLKKEQNKGQEIQNIENEGIEIISLGGVGYNNYLEIAKTLNKKVAILTDNDFITNENKLADISQFNEENDGIGVKIFTDGDKNNWTWEVSLYNLNKELLESKIPLQKGSKYSYKCNNGIEYTGCLGKMLNQKTDIAYLLSTETDIKLIYPDYFKECVEWIRQ